MKEQEIGNIQDTVYRDSTMPITKEIPENRGTRIFVNIYFGFRVFVWFLSGFVPTVMLLVLTSMTQWKPIIMVQAPYFVLVGILFPFVSIHPLYTLLKVRTMSYKGWIFAFTIFIDSIISYLVMRVITIEMANIAVKATSGDSSQFPELFQSPTLNPSTLFFTLIDVIIFGLTVFIWFKLKKKFTNEESKISRKSKYILVVYTVFIIVTVVSVYTPLLMATQEKPFMGYKKSVSDLGRKPVLFQVPDNYRLDYAYNSTSGENGGLTLSYVGDYASKNEKNLMNWVLIIESTKDDQNNIKDISEHITVNGEDVGYIPPKGKEDSSKRHALVMHKNGLMILIVGVDYRNVSKQKLIDIAKTAH